MLLLQQILSNKDGLLLYVTFYLFLLHYRQNQFTNSSTTKNKTVKIAQIAVCHSNYSEKQLLRGTTGIHGFLSQVLQKGVNLILQVPSPTWVPVSNYTTESRNHVFQLAHLSVAS